MLPDTDPHHPAVRHWQALLDARLIGAVPPTPPAVAVQRAANDALFRRIAAARRTVSA